jgi:hypothetical protein
LRKIKKKQKKKEKKKNKTQPSRQRRTERNYQKKLTREKASADEAAATVVDVALAGVVAAAFGAFAAEETVSDVGYERGGEWTEDAAASSRDSDGEEYVVSDGDVQQGDELDLDAPGGADEDRGEREDEEDFPGLFELKQETSKKVEELAKRWESDNARKIQQEIDRVDNYADLVLLRQREVGL